MLDLRLGLLLLLAQLVARPLPPRVVQLLLRNQLGVVVTTTHLIAPLKYLQLESPHNLLHVVHSEIESSILSVNPIPTAGLLIDCASPQVSSSASVAGQLVFDLGCQTTSSSHQLPVGDPPVNCRSGAGVHWRGAAESTRLTYAVYLSRCHGREIDGSCLQISTFFLFSIFRERQIPLYLPCWSVGRSIGWLASPLIFSIYSGIKAT